MRLEQLFEITILDSNLATEPTSAANADRNRRRFAEREARSLPSRDLVDLVGWDEA